MNAGGGVTTGMAAAKLLISEAFSNIGANKQHVTDPGLLRLVPDLLFFSGKLMTEQVYATVEPARVSAGFCHANRPDEPLQCDYHRRYPDETN